MPCNAIIGYETKEGGYVGVYCHTEGEPKKVIPILENLSYELILSSVKQSINNGAARRLTKEGLESNSTYYGKKQKKTKWVYTEWPTERSLCYSYRKNIDGTVESC